MREPYVQLLIQLVWTTWDRQPLLVGPVHARAILHVADHARRLGCDPVHVGGVADHVHVLLGLPPSLAVATRVQRLKGASSHMLNKEFAELAFRWQGGYGAFSVSRSGYEACRDYVINQQHHHSALTLQSDWESTTQTQPGGGQACQL